MKSIRGGKSIRWGLAVLGLAMLCAPAAAQNRPSVGNLPAVGTMLPDVTVFDDQGKKFSTAQLRGHHSVLVFGCLT